MRVIITAGGTGGHIYPAISIINKIKEKESVSKFLYIGTHNRMEKDIVPSLGYDYKSIEIYGFSKKNIKLDKDREDSTDKKMVAVLTDLINANFKNLQKDPNGNIIYTLLPIVDEKENKNELYSATYFLPL